MIWAGLLAVLAGAAMQGSFALPQKYVRGWPWEKTWLFYSITAMIVFPWLIVALVIPDAGAVYGETGAGVLARTALFGAGWGIGSVLFGLGIAQVGIALGFAIIISLTAAVGSLGLLVLLHPGQVFTMKGALLAFGLAVAIAGVALCARAGAMKEATPAARGNFARGLAICIASGLTSPMMNFAFEFGKPIADQAVRQGASAGNSAISIFAVSLSSGFVINASYCIYLLARNRTWTKGLAADRPRNLALASAMGFLWLFGWFFYGWGATWLGSELGAVLGWPILMVTMVLVANFWGLATGEWKHAGRRAFRYLGAGIALMIAALAIIAAGARS